jgi:hypothetical protein
VRNVQRFVRYARSEMQQERTTWNDARLDELVSEIRVLRNAIDDRFDRIDDRFDGQAERFEKRFDNLTYGLIYSMASLLAAFGGALVAL